MSRAKADARMDCRVTLDQDVWWQNKEGTYMLVSSMDAPYRHNVARWLIDRAAVFHLRKVQAEFFRGRGEYDDDGWDELPDEDYVRKVARKRQEKGEHLDLVRNSVLYRAMAR